MFSLAHRDRAAPLPEEIVRYAARDLCPRREAKKVRTDWAAPVLLNADVSIRGVPPLVRLSLDG